VSPSLLAIIAYAWWGVVPLYWKQLKSFPAEELILYRVLLSSLFLLPFFWFSKGHLQIGKRKLLGLFASGSLIGFNWYLYVWAVNHNHVVDASLGYFLNPLINVALGKFLLNEKMNRNQGFACALAAFGSGILAISTGSFPWIALLLATSFALYGFIRKKLHVSTISGTFFETTFLAFPTLIGLVIYYQLGLGYAPQASKIDWIWLSATGIVTTIPLLAFAEAAKGMALSSLGFFQFISPSIQFLLGIFVYHEPFSLFQWISFAFIWMGLGFFFLDLRNQKKSIARRNKNEK
jgi:chloramphenicol-sensitive protein RarD